MDSIIKSRLTQDIILYPCVKKVEGDPIFGAPVTYQGYFVPGGGVIVNRNGEEVVSKGKVYLDGMVYVDLTDDDMIVIPTRPNRKYPIQLLIPYPGLNVTWEIMEVII